MRIAGISAASDRLTGAHRIADANADGPLLQVSQNHVPARRLNRDVVSERAFALALAFMWGCIGLAILDVHNHAAAWRKDRLIPRFPIITKKIVGEVLIAHGRVVIEARIRTAGSNAPTIFERRRKDDRVDGTIEPPAPSREPLVKKQREKRNEAHAPADPRDDTPSRRRECERNRRDEQQTTAAG